MAQGGDWQDCSNTQVGMQKRLPISVQEPPTMGYQYAKKMLVEKYGNPYHFMVEYRKKIKA